MSFLPEGFSSFVGEVLTNWTQGRDPSHIQNPYELQGKFNTTRDSVRNDARAIGFEGDFRTPSVQTTDNFERHDLATLREKVDKIDLEAVNNLKDAWNKIGTQETTSLTTFQQAMGKATNEGIWRGQSRNAAAKAVTDYTSQASKVAKAAALTSNKLSELATGLAPTKTLVPHVPGHRSGVSNAVNLVVGKGWRDDVTAYNNAYTEAKRVLTTVYAPVVHESDTGVPVIPKPNTQDPAGPGDQPPPSSWRPGGNGPGPSGPGGTHDTNQPKPGDQNQNGQGSNSQTSQSNPSGNGQTDGSQNAGDQARTDPSSATTPSGLDPSSLGSSGSSLPGGSGSGLGGGLGGTNGPNGHGSSVPGGVQPGALAGAGGRATASAARAGASGMPGMGGAGRGKGDKEEERTKSVADYLINQENGDELTGIPDLPKTVPPVIGE
ncbi:hypothetical protein A5780_20115 [Nocardia sp. 852002-20019_SCH5090214]|uniref:PPE family domain-containing protein n=1 Tax=Nocardia nova TaxID=37330 RepID=A0A2S6AFJ4_9NOCA|nr:MULTISPECIES: hypothetical protein [Nocardia]OBA61079.1 hypothetical protein A5780_20115 [Nocardia sp. 852002-20019_SCH5090214]PPJ33190.1 hypothetical protein C5F51_02655 [Nocardia nova]